MTTRKITIYDYRDEAVEAEIPDKPIKEIRVTVISGDEVCYIEYEDGTSVEVDSSHDRILHFLDGVYLIDGEDEINRWLNFTPSYSIAASYERRDMFDNDDLEGEPK